MNMSQMHNHPHPSYTLRDDVLPAPGISQTDAAAQLGITRTMLCRVLNGHAGISIEMALWIKGWLGINSGGRAEVWLAKQAAYDLWKVRKAGAPKAGRAKIARREEIA